MSKIIPFSEIENVSTSLGTEKYCLLDTNFTIAILHTDHKFNYICQDFFKKAAKSDFTFFVTHTARTEFLDIERKFGLTGPIRALISEQGKWAPVGGRSKLNEKMKSAINTALENLNKSSDGFKFFSDKDLKNLKIAFYPFNESGKVGWVNFCQEFLKTDITSAWDLVVSKLGLNYLDLREVESKMGQSGCLIKRKIEWGRMVDLMGKSALGSSDAMMANAFDCSLIQVMATTDYDFAYSLALEKSDQYVAIPDSMFNEHKGIFRKIANKL